MWNVKCDIYIQTHFCIHKTTLRINSVIFFIHTFYHSHELLLLLLCHELKSLYLLIQHLLLIPCIILPLSLRSCSALDLSMSNSSFSQRRKVNICELVLLDFFSFGQSSPFISLRFLVSPYRFIAVFPISKAVCLSFSIDFLSATSCSDFNSLSSYLSIRSSSRVSHSVSSCPSRPVTFF